MKSVTKEKHREAFGNLDARRLTNPKAPNLELYQKIVDSVYVGSSVADVGCGQCYLKLCLEEIPYYPIDAFPILDHIISSEAEQLIHSKLKVDTTFALAMLDNVRNLKNALKGIKQITKKNIVILTGIGVEPDRFHTVRVDKEDLTEVLGEPKQEILISGRVYLFEFEL